MPSDVHWDWPSSGISITEYDYKARAGLAFYDLLECLITWVPNFSSIVMRFFVKLRVLETNADDKPIRTAVGAQIQKLMALR
jgi:hypothetical protein